MRLPPEYHQRNVERVNKMSVAENFELAVNGYELEYPYHARIDIRDIVSEMSVAECKEWAVFYEDEIDRMWYEFDNFCFSDYM